MAPGAVGPAEGDDGHGRALRPQQVGDAGVGPHRLPRQEAPRLAQGGPRGVDHRHRRHRLQVTQGLQEVAPVPGVRPLDQGHRAHDPASSASASLARRLVRLAPVPPALAARPALPPPAHVPGPARSARALAPHRVPALHHLHQLRGVGHGLVAPAPGDGRRQGVQESRRGHPGGELPEAQGRLLPEGHQADVRPLRRRRAGDGGEADGGQAPPAGVVEGVHHVAGGPVVGDGAQDVARAQEVDLGQHGARVAGPGGAQAEHLPAVRGQLAEGHRRPGADEQHPARPGQGLHRPPRGLQVEVAHRVLEGLDLQGEDPAHQAPDVPVRPARARRAVSRRPGSRPPRRSPPPSPARGSITEAGRA